MAFKMKGSSYRMGGHKTKATMAYMKSPLEQAKPDYPDIDRDGNTTESMKEAAKSIAKMKSPMKQEEAPISSVTGKPYPPYVMKKSPEGEYSARQQAMESFDKMKFAEKGVVKTDEIGYVNEEGVSVDIDGNPK